MIIPAGTPLRADGHWSVTGLIGAWPLNAGAGIGIADAAGGFIGFVGDGVWSANGLRVAHPTNKPRIPSFSLPNPTFTVVVKMKFVTIGGGQPSQIFGKRAAWNSANGMALWHGYSTSDDASFSVNSTRATSGSILTANTDYVIAGLCDYSSISIWINGTKQGESAFTGPIVQNANDYNILGFNSPSDDVLIDGMLLYGRGLSPAEIASLSANPYQIFVPVGLQTITLAGIGNVAAGTVSIAGNSTRTLAPVGIAQAKQTIAATPQEMTPKLTTYADPVLDRQVQLIVNRLNGAQTAKWG